MFGQVALAQFGIGREEILPNARGTPIALDGLTALFEGGDGRCSLRGARDDGDASRRIVSMEWKKTSRLSGNSRKKDRSCMPARAAICAPVVWSKPWAAKSSTAALASRPRGSGSQRPMARF
ncbi:hypothetical protein [Streptomyces malaysiensis]|nr:hypothetical protein [Streptomyces malaysiensis]